MIATVLVNAFSLALLMGMLNKRLSHLHLHRLLPAGLSICIAGGASGALSYTSTCPFHETSEQLLPCSQLLTTIMSGLFPRYSV